ncbi:efflux RND transporter periplasmic adaptor subunit [uncultured Thiohalocapsa sp.]|uniref:efflux RND transporter periplasmic adaptor subunit n=1 Tax=uncultured Thiohalocapsa sp. TaxID=768990 RepID=UPI0025D38781|nr:biotin/lipoyl-binding protein [uncultured Thiohalocapsa sp.]
MRTVFKILLPILVLAIGFGAFRVLKSTKPEQTPPEVQERIWRVEVERAVPQRLAPELTLYGRVETPDLMRATASAPAWVTEVAVRDGDRIAEGDVLVRLDERDFLPRIAQARAQIAELEAQIDSERNRYETDKLALEKEKRLLALARDAVARQERLKTQRVGAEQALDEAEQAAVQQALAVSNREMTLADHPTRLRALEARLASNRARLDELELEYARATVRAPYDGIVTGVEVTVGDQVSKGQVLARMFALDSLQVRARVPAPYQAELVTALRERGELPAEAEIGKQALALTLDRIAGEAGPSGVDGLFHVAGDPAALRLGQMLTLRLERPARDAVIAVPFRAVYGGGRVYKLEAGRMVGVDVETLGERRGGDAGERLLVRSPQIQAGDLIVTTHMPNAVDGLRVETLAEGRVAKAPAGSDRPGGAAASAGSTDAGKTQAVQ